jgi:repressor LexA
VIQPVTARQAEIFGWVEAFIARKGYPPTRAEIAEAFSFRSVNAAHQVLLALERKGALRITPGISRGIVLLATSKRTEP